MTRSRALLVVMVLLLAATITACQPISPPPGGEVPTPEPTPAGAEPAQDLFLDVPEGDAQMDSLAPAPEDPTVVRQRYVIVNTDALDSNVGEPSAPSAAAPDVGEPNAAAPSAEAVPPAPVQLNLFDDVSVTLYTQSVEEGPLGVTNWVARTEGSDFDNAVMVVKDGLITGNIIVDNTMYQIRPAGDSIQSIAEIDQSRFPEELEPETPEYDTMPADNAEVNAAFDEAGILSPIIDVMVLYTPNAHAASIDIDAEIALAILETNTSYRNSAINQRVRLVDAEEIAYAESGALQTDRNRLQNPSDGQMDNVHALRNAHNADLVSLWVQNGDGCGIAFIMNPVSVGFEPFGFSVTLRSCATGNFTFGHEMGHNMGARHDRFVDPTDNSPFTFNHGFVSVADRWRTVMAYNNQCANSGVNCTRLPFWSNPDGHLSGAAMGVAEGLPQAADNRTTLNRTGGTIARFRLATLGDGSFNVTNAAVANFPVWAGDRDVEIVKGDFNGDGRTDMALVRRDAGWASVPVAFSNGNGSFNVTNAGVANFPSWAADSDVEIVSGDFNADGRMDMALVRRDAGWASVPIAFSNGDGSFNVTNAGVANFPIWAADSDVEIVKGDFNNDGRTDMALVRRDGGWASVPVAFSNGDGSFNVTNAGVANFPGWAASSGVKIVSGDFNADGQADMALVRQDAGWASVPVAFSNGDGSFNVTNAGVANFPGWAASSGVEIVKGDFNNDGRTDMALVRHDGGWASVPVAFSNGNGSFNVTNAGVANFPGWAASSGVEVVSGDFNNDGRTDMALVRQDAGWASVPIAFSNGNGGFNVTNAGVTNFPGWAADNDVEVVSGDFNGDGQADMALVRRDGGWASVPIAFSR